MNTECMFSMFGTLCALLVTINIKFFLNTVNFPGSLIDDTNLSRGFVKDFKKYIKRAIQFLLILMIPSDVLTTDTPCRKLRSTWHLWCLFLTHQPTIFFTI